MATVLDYPHIIKRPGEPAYLENHPRMPVSIIVAYHTWHGWSAAELADGFPHLTLAEIHAALAYYYDHQDEMDQESAKELAEAERDRLAQLDSPLFARLKALARQRQNLLSV